ncbi:MAG: protein kinase [Geothrix sp.]|uniref:protein kinase domain-containing protein n=1 Tax=Geothrix sp. TaxID=1962974 RepID=UPI001805AFE2|nr:serine/threonine-protein kinase [Geothrix sp.]NWJ42312.1 protein kinase [Geothrix sp.]WIL19720.1 MAG: protein kinase [Geothrix sp.]
MSTAGERALALAVACGLLEPGEARDTDLETLVAAGRLTREDCQGLLQDLADLEEVEASHWSLDVTAQTPLPTHGDPAETDPSGPSAGPSDPGRRFRKGDVFQARTLARWARFENLELLGEGGMGRIFKATDPSLHRLVALKLLRREDPDLLQRFIQEAQLQARVDHPNVCRVYEVGEWRGQPYIAMQFLSGATLQRAAPALSVEALLRYMVDVCEGVHAAHRVGLVHRDLKPANLMIDRLEDGSTRACVLDFGLARGTESQGLTETGRIIGTVAFMSPEQARGDAARLDRRSDVYSLGATLQALLTGSPPFPGEGLECMSHIVKDDPVPLRRRLPMLSADLETVVLTCLQKDPRRRYATARALGEDLQRILDGESIEARAATRLEKGVHWARKHTVLVAATAAVLLSTAVFGGFAVRERLRARAQAAHAQRFAQAAERIEALARYLKLSPPHDLGPELRDLEGRVARLEAEAHVEGASAEAPGQYALGRARLALGQPESARTHLERARALGFDTPELRSALGRALLELHQKALDEAWRIGPEDARKEALGRLQAVAVARIEPLLRSGATASLIPLAYLEGQAAWVAGRWEEAIAKARAAQGQAPWFYEARLLEAQALLSWGLPKSGPERDGILAEAHRSAQAALMAAPCDVQALGLAGRIGVMRYGLFVSDPVQGRAIHAGVEGVVAALRILEPGGSRAAILEASLLTAEAVNAQVAGRPGAAPLRRALALLAPLLEAPDPPFDALEGAMQAECYAIKFPEMGDPIPWLDRALAHGREALDRRPGHSSLANELARVSVWRLSEGTLRGEPPWEVFESALQVILRGLEREPDAKSLREALGYLWGERAEYERTHGMDPRPSLEQSMQSFEMVLRQGPSFRSHYGMANAALMRGQWETVHRQAGAEASLERADQAYRQARLLAPFHSVLGANLVEVALWRGMAAGFGTVDGERAMREGEAQFQEDVKRFAQIPTLWLRGAQLAKARGQAKDAKARIQRAFALDPHNPEIRRLLQAVQAGDQPQG